MTRLFESPECFDTEQRLEEDLPGMSSLAGGSRAELGLAQADGALTTLKAFLGDEVVLPSTNAVREKMSGNAADATALRTAILALHVDLLVGLTAADFRLGKAYGLGRALADTCAPAYGELAELHTSIQYHLDPHRALVLVGWLDDLRTVLPDHAGQSVSVSLQRWIQWWAKTALDDADEKEVKRVARRLHRQGQRWRAILSGEKMSKDLLATDDYVEAGRGMLRRAGQIVLSFASQLWAPLTVAGLLLLVGIALMFIDNSTGQVLAGLGTVAGGLGITWRSATSSLGRISHRLGEPLWGAELDRVIADRLTSLPQHELREDPAGPSPGGGEPGDPAKGRPSTLAVLAGILAATALAIAAAGIAHRSRQGLGAPLLFTAAAVCLALATVALALFLARPPLRHAVLISGAILTTLTIGLSATLAVSFSKPVPGPPGPQGLQGLQGKRGPEGKRGPQGKRGSVGEQGPRGFPGSLGSSGRFGADQSLRALTAVP